LAVNFRYPTTLLFIIYARPKQIIFWCFFRHGFVIVCGIL
jgi:hypothetical protein